MPEIRRLANDGIYDAETLKLLSDVLADVWTEVGSDFETKPEIEQARNLIAKCLLYYANLGLSDPAALKSQALQALRQDYPKAAI